MVIHDSLRGHYSFVQEIIYGLSKLDIKFPSRKTHQQLHEQYIKNVHYFPGTIPTSFRILSLIINVVKNKVHQFPLYLLKFVRPNETITAQYNTTSLLQLVITECTDWPLLSFSMLQWRCF